MLKLTTRVGCAVCVLLLQVAPTHAESDPPENFRLEMGWDITVDGEAAGTEEATYVESATTKTVFLSGKKTSAAKGAPMLVTHVQRDPDGQLRKYRRHQKVRKGQGVHAFQKGSAIRIVGVNLKVAPVELASATSAYVWDPEVWHPLALWVRSSAWVHQGQLSVLDVASRTLSTVTVEGAGEVSMTDGAGAAIEVIRWRLKGLHEGGPLEVFVSRGLLRGVKQGAMTMVEKGWAWVAPKVETLDPAEVDPGAPAGDAPAPTPSPGGDAPAVDPGDGP